MCELGTVVDLSASGMKVLSTRPRKGYFDLHVCTEVQRVKIRAEVLWCKRMGFRCHLLGLRFFDADSFALQSLGKIAARHRALQTI